LYAGTYDDEWQQSRAPYLPRDFDARFFQLAPPGLVMEGKYLQGGEYVDVRGATAEGILQFRLPRVHVAIAYRMRGSSQPRPANLDTVILLPDAQRFILVWRAAFQCDKQLLQIDEVTADIAAVA
jgi:hypothetical protein